MRERGFKKYLILKAAVILAVFLVSSSTQAEDGNRNIAVSIAGIFKNQTPEVLNAQFVDYGFLSDTGVLHEQIQSLLGKDGNKVRPYEAMKEIMEKFEPNDSEAVRVFLADVLTVLNEAALSGNVSDHYRIADFPSVLNYQDGLSKWNENDPIFVIVGYEVLTDEDTFASVLGVVELNVYGKVIKVTAAPYENRHINREIYVSTAVKTIESLLN